MSSDLPPFGYFRSLVTPLMSSISDGAYRLLALVAAHNWDGEGWPVPASNREIDQMVAARLGCSTRTARAYRSELFAAGFLAETELGSSGERLWIAQGVAASSEAFSTALQAPVENSVDNPTDGKNFSQNVGNFLPKGRAYKEEVICKDVLPPPPYAVDKEGAGKKLPTGQKIAHGANPVADHVASVVALLKQRGIWEAPAWEIARRAEEAGVDRRTLLTIADHHLAETGGNVQLAAWRLRELPLTPPAPPKQRERARERLRDEFRSLLD